MSSPAVTLAFFNEPAGDALGGGDPALVASGDPRLKHDVAAGRGDLSALDDTVNGDVLGGLDDYAVPDTAVDKDRPIKLKRAVVGVQVAVEDKCRLYREAVISE